MDDLLGTQTILPVKLCHMNSRKRSHQRLLTTKPPICPICEAPDFKHSELLRTSQRTLFGLPKTAFTSYQRPGVEPSVNPYIVLLFRA